MLQKFLENRGAGARLMRILGAGMWSLTAGMGAYVLRIANSLIMTRILVPEMFGVMALASTLMVMVNMFSDLGLRQAVIRSPRGTEPDFLNTAWTLQVIRGVIIWMVCLAVALALYLMQGQQWLSPDSVYADPVLPAVIAATTFGAVIGGFLPTKWMIASRELKLRVVTLIELGSQLLGIIVMIILGWYTRSIWSLVIGGLVTAAVWTVLTEVCISGQSNRFCWDRDSLKELVGFGRWIMISSICSVIAEHGDRILLGIWVAPQVLGFYVLAMNLNSIIIKLSGRLFGTIGMPALSEVERENPRNFARAYRRMRVPFDITCLASAGLLFSLGQLIIDLMYDPRYRQSGEIVEVLSFLVIFSRYGIATSAYTALGVPRYLTVINFVKSVSIYTLTPILYSFYGFQGALWAIALHPLPSVPFVYWFNRRHRLNDFGYELLIAVWWPIGYVAGLGLSAAFRYLFG